MQVDICEEEGVIVFDLEGRIIGRHSVEMKEAIDQYIRGSTDVPKLLFNLSEVPMIDSSGLGTLLAAHVSVRRDGGRIGVIHVGDHIRNLLVMARIIAVLEHFDETVAQQNP